jgi:hypothetical protein
VDCPFQVGDRVLVPFFPGLELIPGAVVGGETRTLETAEQREYLCVQLDEPGLGEAWFDCAHVEPEPPPRRV